MRIRDPVHGDITVDPVARELLDTKLLQRLRGIKQLGLTYLVYPGAVHTRFEHSLGTYHMAKRLYLTLNDEPSNATLVALGCAALLHDVGHLPYGHTLEEEFALFGKHDSKERITKALDTLEVKAILTRAGLFNEVSAILLDRLPRSQAYLTEIIKGTIDADVLDYLRRDAYFAGLVHNYDDRILDNFVVMDGRLIYRLVHKGLPRPDARSELVHLLRLRYYLTERLYYHHAKLSAGVMLAKLVTRAGFTEALLESMTDGELLERGLQRAKDRNDGQLMALAEGLSRRKLYKRAFVHTADRTLEQVWQDRGRFEELIADEAGLAKDEVGLYLGPRGVMKEAGVTVLTKDGCLPLASRESQDIEALALQYANLTRFYVFAPAEKSLVVRLAVERILGRTSEYRKDLTSL